MARILLINDEPELLQLCTWILEEHGHVVLGIEGSRQSVNRVKSFRPDLIVLDWVMPRISGGEMVRLLRADPTTSRIPIVLMSALADGRARAERLGLAGFLSKPFDEARLTEIVARVLEREGPRPAA